MCFENPVLDTRYRGLLIALTDEEQAALEADIVNRGLLQPILVDEDNTILDGHHRYDVCIRQQVEITTRVVSGLESDLEKRLYVLQSNDKRRNSTKEEKENVRKQQIEIYRQLRVKDPKKWPFERIAKECGVGKSTVADWFRKDGTGSAKQDSRRTLAVGEERQILQEIESGTPVSEVAKNHGISRGRVSQIRKSARNLAETTDEQTREDAEMEELIAEGEEYLRQAFDCFYPFDDEVARWAVEETFGRHFDIWR
jgi:ParB-like chromosome segregation protein Spo0J